MYTSSRQKITRGSPSPYLALLFFLPALLLAGCQVEATNDSVPTMPSIAPSTTPSASSRSVVTVAAHITAIPFLSSPAGVLLFPSGTLTPTTTFLPSSVETGPPAPYLFLPNSEVVYSPSATGFDVRAYLNQTGGYLREYQQYLMITKWTSGADIITRVALENSINPRLLLALLEYQCGCVLGPLPSQSQTEYLMGATDYRRKDLYGQLTWAVHELSEGYYGWQAGTLTEISLRDGTIIHPSAEMNAGSMALQYIFAQLYSARQWEQALSPQQGFMALYQEMFGDPWERAQTVEPLIPANLVQPPLILPFQVGDLWSFTAGPHSAWEKNAPLAALDFAPASAEAGCVDSDAWVVAAADGIVVRSEYGAVIQDLDGDGNEQTGWDILYMHIAKRDRSPSGTYLHTGDPIGHPSCQGGRATGTHLHIARKFNGEWIPAGGSLPFILSGWVTHAGGKLYAGSLTRNSQIVTSNLFSSHVSKISRSK